MFPRCAMILQADSHDVSFVKNIIVANRLSRKEESATRPAETMAYKL